MKKPKGKRIKQAMLGPPDKACHFKPGMKRCSHIRATSSIVVHTQLQTLSRRSTETPKATKKKRQDSNTQTSKTGEIDSDDEFMVTSEKRKRKGQMLQER